MGVCVPVIQNNLFHFLLLFLRTNIASVYKTEFQRLKNKDDNEFERNLRLEMVVDSEQFRLAVEA